jgi:hypothetical protein
MGHHDDTQNATRPAFYGTPPHAFSSGLPKKSCHSSYFFAIKRQTTFTQTLELPQNAHIPLDQRKAEFQFTEEHCTTRPAQAGSTNNKTRFLWGSAFEYKRQKAITRSVS